MRSVRSWVGNFIHIIPRSHYTIAREISAKNLHNFMTKYAVMKMSISSSNSKV